MDASAVRGEFADRRLIVSASQLKKLRQKSEKCFRLADRTTDDKVAAALLAYGCELEQRARLIESTKNKPVAKNERTKVSVISG